MSKQRIGRKEIDMPIILTFIIIYVSNDTLLFGTNVDRTFFWIHVGILLLTFLYLLSKTKTVSRQIFAVSTLLTFMMVITGLVNWDTEIIKYLYNIFVVLLCMLFTSVIKRHVFFGSFSYIMSVLSTFSIALFLLATAAHPLVRFFPTIENENYVRYHFLGLGFLESLNAGVLPRMYGIFREPGVFATLLTMALIIELFFVERLNAKRVIVFSVAVILTFSTAGYILLFSLYAVFLAKLISRGSSRVSREILLLLFLLMIGLVVFFLFIDMQTVIRVVFNKLFTVNSSRESRLGSIAANLSMFQENPLLGKGWYFVEDEFIGYSAMGTYRGEHNTNTFLKFMALYGIVPAFVMGVGMFLLFKRECKGNVLSFVIVFLWLVALSNEDLSVNILFYLLPMYGLYDQTIRIRRTR